MTARTGTTGYWMMRRAAWAASAAIPAARSPKSLSASSGYRSMSPVPALFWHGAGTGTAGLYGPPTNTYDPRAHGGPHSAKQWELRHAFHAEQARLPGNRRHVISAVHEHELHQSDPGLVIAAIQQVVHSAYRRCA